MGLKRVGRDTASLFQNIENIGKIVKFNIDPYNLSDPSSNRSLVVSHNLGFSPSSVIIIKSNPSGSKYKGSWVNGVVYNQDEVFEKNGILYSSSSNFNTGVFNTDFNNGGIGFFLPYPIYIRSWNDKSFEIVNYSMYSYNIEVLIVR